MEEYQKEIITNFIITITEKANILKEEKREHFIASLTKKNINEAIDDIIISLDHLIKRKKITMKDILEESTTLLLLDKENYKTIDDYIKRFHELEQKNLLDAKMSLKENHKMIIEAFEKLNHLLQNKFDCYYTGGIFCYLATGIPLERYHSDLDLLFNEDELFQLKNLIDESDEFVFLSNMKHKEKHGHEYKIVYKNSPISIGLFLFERRNDKSITTKEYYYEKNILYVDEHRYTKENTILSFDDIPHYFNGTFYKRISLEKIYFNKINGREKDKYDAKKIEKKINKKLEHVFRIENRKTQNMFHRQVNHSIVNLIEEKKDAKIPKI